MNPFLVYPIDHPRLPALPGRLYARLDDAIETAKPGDWYLRLGCVEPIGSTVSKPSSPVRAATRGRRLWKT